MYRSCLIWSIRSLLYSNIVCSYICLFRTVRDTFSYLLFCVLNLVVGLTNRYCTTWSSFSSSFLRLDFSFRPVFATVLYYERNAVYCLPGATLLDLIIVKAAWRSAAWRQERLQFKLFVLVTDKDWSGGHTQADIHAVAQASGQIDKQVERNHFNGKRREIMISTGRVYIFFSRDRQASRHLWWRHDIDCGWACRDRDSRVWRGQRCRRGYRDGASWLESK